MGLDAVGVRCRSAVAVAFGRAREWLGRRAGVSGYKSTALGDRVVPRLLSPGRVFTVVATRRASATIAAQSVSLTRRLRARSASFSSCLRRSCGRSSRGRGCGCRSGAEATGRSAAQAKPNKRRQIARLRRIKRCRAGRPCVGRPMAKAMEVEFCPGADVEEPSGVVGLERSEGCSELGQRDLGLSDGRLCATTPPP